MPSEIIVFWLTTSQVLRRRWIGVELRPAMMWMRVEKLLRARHRCGRARALSKEGSLEQS